MKTTIALIILLCASVPAIAGHPATNGKEMQHGTIEVPTDANVPHVDAALLEDSMDGYNLLLTLTHFTLLPPLSGAEARAASGDILQGHMHLFINGVKVMRLYGPSVHLPSALLNDGVNSVTVSINNHRHSTYTWQGQEIQSTLLVDTRSDDFVKNNFAWPSLSQLASPLGGRAPR